MCGDICSNDGDCNPDTSIKVLKKLSRDIQYLNVDVMVLIMEFYVNIVLIVLNVVIMNVILRVNVPHANLVMVETIVNQKSARILIYVAAMESKSIY